MKNNLKIGRGTLEEFKAAYDAVAEKNQGKMWSQLYLSGKAVSGESEKNVYEWLIGSESYETQQQAPQQPAKPAFVADI